MWGWVGGGVNTCGEGVNTCGGGGLGGEYMWDWRLGG